VLECPSCGGRGCEGCDGGEWALTSCPREFVDAELWEVIGYAELYRKGCPPVAGGSLDQTRWFVQASRLIWAEEAYWQAKLKIPG